MDEGARLVGKEAHNAAHDGRGIGQREATELRGAHVGLFAAGGAGHEGGEVIFLGKGRVACGGRRGLGSRGLDGAACELGSDGLGGGFGIGGRRGFQSLLLFRLRAVGGVSEGKLRLHQAAHEAGADTTAAALGCGGICGCRCSCGGSAGLLGHECSGGGVELHGFVRARGLDELAGVRDDDTALHGLHELDHLGVGKARDVVDDGGANTDGRLRNLDVACVDRNDGAALRECTDDGKHALGLLVRRDRREARTRGLAAHIDDVGAGIEHCHAARNGGVDVEVAFVTVAERVRRDVEHAHNAGTVELELVLSAAPGLGIVSHGDPFASRAAPGGRASDRLRIGSYCIHTRGQVRSGAGASRKPRGATGNGAVEGLREHLLPTSR